MSKNNGYQASLDELQDIIQAMESGKIPVDQLSEKVKRAVALIRVCRTVLSNTEEDVKQILSELEAEKNGTAQE
jgi:exodeoxyribonuclease VII small subunit